MARPPHPQRMMDHYEELGVDRSASPDEIRHAYKRLVRLLHPDHCSDESVRQLAELQMKRLNGMLAVLTNPAERARYDRTLVLNATPWQLPQLPAVSPPNWFRAPQWFWMIAGAMAILSLFSLLSGTPHPPAATRPKAPAAAATPAASQTAHPAAGSNRFPARIARIGPRRSEEPSPPQMEAPAPLNSQRPADYGMAPIQAPIRLEAPLLATRIEPPRPPGLPTLSGEWLFVPSGRPSDQGLYPPEYIELRVTEEAGVLRGRYRARYRIPDQAISPTVWFQFAGPAESDRATLPWSGIGGARGEVSLRLMVNGALEVTWTATQIGEELGLISGTARLVRRAE